MNLYPKSGFCLKSKLCVRLRLVVWAFLKKRSHTFLTRMIKNFCSPSQFGLYRKTQIEEKHVLGVRRLVYSFCYSRCFPLA